MTRRYFKYRSEHKNAISRMINDNVPYSKIYDRMNEIFVSDGPFTSAQIRGLIKQIKLTVKRDDKKCEDSFICSNCGNNLVFNEKLRIFECNNCNRACWIFEYFSI